MQRHRVSWALLFWIEYSLVLFFFRPIDREPCDLNWIFVSVSVVRSIVKISTENNANAKMVKKKSTENEAKQK